MQKSQETQQSQNRQKSYKEPHTINCQLLQKSEEPHTIPITQSPVNNYTKSHTQWLINSTKITQITGATQIILSLANKIQNHQQSGKHLRATIDPS